MAADDDNGYDYYPGLSTAGIFYDSQYAVPRFAGRFSLNRLPHLPKDAKPPIKVCSSSDGLIACYDPLSNIYYIGNPAIPNSYTTLPETPRQHNPLISNVVLVSDYSVQHVYHLICATLDGMTLYNFDVYSSCHGRWISHERIDLGCHLYPNSGVSCGTFAYWLTDVVLYVIRFDVNCPQNMVLSVSLKGRIRCLGGTKLQLGRVGNRLGLVTLHDSSDPMVILYIWEAGNLSQFEPCESFNLSIPNLTKTKLIRFQSFKVELFFWVDGQLFMWEKNTFNHGTRLLMENRGVIQISHGIPHVITTLLPENFPIMI